LSGSLETHHCISRIITNKPEEVMLLGHEYVYLTSLVSQWLTVARLPHPTCVNSARRWLIWNSGPSGWLHNNTHHPKWKLGVLRPRFSSKVQSHLLAVSLATSGVTCDCLLSIAGLFYPGLFAGVMQGWEWGHVETPFF